MDELDNLPLKAPRTHGVPRSARTKALKAHWMRQNPTLGESAFMMLLQRLGIDKEFEAQAQVAGYILDFYHCGLKPNGARCKPFCVEIDGSSHRSVARRAADAQRTAVLERLGITVVRFWNEQVIKEAASVGLAVMKLRG